MKGDWSITLRKYWHALKRRAWMPVLLAFTAASAAGCLALLTPANYTASATVIARSQASSSEKTVSFIEVATSSALARRVIDKLSLHEGVDELAQRIKVTATSNSELYRITVTDRDERAANKLAHTAAEEAATLYQQLAVGGNDSFAADLDSQEQVLRHRYAQAVAALVSFNQEHPDAAARKNNPDNVAVTSQALELQLEEQAASSAFVAYEENASRARVDELTRIRGYASSVVSDDPVTSDRMARFLRVPVAAAVAILVGAGLVLLLEYLDTAIRDPEALEELMGAPVVAVIPHSLTPVLRVDKGVGG